MSSRAVGKFGAFVISIRSKLWYALFMAFLACVSGAMLAYEFFGKNVTAELIRTMTDLDLGIAYIFLVDFALGTYFASHKLRHLRENWLDLLGSIPLSDGVFQAMRILRFVRVVRILRAANAGLNIQDGIEMLSRNYKKKKTRKRHSSKTQSK